MHVRICTSFNCEITGVTGNFRSSQLPFVDQSGAVISNESDWLRARNKQRNWETLTQLVGLYTQMLNVSRPTYDTSTHMWSFEFDIEFPGIFANSQGSLGILIQQASNVPMITGLGEQTSHSWLVPNKNILIQEISERTDELAQS